MFLVLFPNYANVFQHLVKSRPFAISRTAPEKQPSDVPISSQLLQTQTASTGPVLLTYLQIALQILDSKEAVSPPETRQSPPIPLSLGSPETRRPNVSMKQSDHNNDPIPASPYAPSLLFFFLFLLLINQTLGTVGVLCKLHPTPTWQ